MDIQTALDISLNRYLSYLAGRNVSEHTATAYRTDLTQFFSYLQENVVTVVDHQGKISVTHIGDFLSH